MPPKHPHQTVGEDDNSETGARKKGRIEVSGYTYSERYKAADADVELVSSDGVIHKVHSYRLQAAS